MLPTEPTTLRNAWDSIAVNYDKYVTPAANLDLAKTALELAGLKPDMHFLDVASGSGSLSLPAAQKGANVLAVDISPVMIERLKARAVEEGLTNLKGRVMDGHQLDLSDNKFNITGSQFGVMLFPDFGRGLREMVRVTKPGGTVFLVAFGPMQKVEFLSEFLRALKEVDPEFKGLPTETPPLPFQVSDKNVFQQKLEEAGLKNVKVKPTVHEMHFHSGKEMWNWVTNSNPIGKELVSGFDDEQKLRIQKILDKMIRERAAGRETAILKAAVNIGIGRK